MATHMLSDKCRPTCRSVCGNEPTMGSDGKDKGATTASNIGGMGDGGGIYTLPKLTRGVPYFSRSSEIWLIVVVSAPRWVGPWRLYFS